MKLASRYAFLAALVVSTACTVHGTDVPELSGPSEFAQSITVTAVPDTIQQDGFSQALVTVIARGPDGKGLPGLVVRMQTATGDAIQDFGVLSARSVVTGSDGRATITYTAPPPPPFGSNGSRVTILATPIGSNYDASQTQTADIRLTAPGVVLPPASAPTAVFAVSPTPATAGVPLYFDGARSCSTQAPCSTTAGIVEFLWNFGDGTTGVGQSTTHAFPSAGTYAVTLTVTNDRGLSTTASQGISVQAGTPPTADFVVSPAGPRAGVAVNFNASTSTAVSGRRITQYLWNFGDGTPDQGGMLTTHAFAAAGTYTVVLTVVDDSGQRGTRTAAVTVLP